MRNTKNCLLLLSIALVFSINCTAFAGGRTSSLSEICALKPGESRTLMTHYLTEFFRTRSGFLIQRGPEIRIVPYEVICGAKWKLG